MGKAMHTKMDGDAAMQWTWVDAKEDSKKLNVSHPVTIASINNALFQPVESRFSQAHKLSSCPKLPSETEKAH
jgi:hypothetical protein